MPHNYFKEEQYTSNPTVYKRVYLFRVLGCSFCPPNRNENYKRVSKEDRYKSVRKGRCGGKSQPLMRHEDGTPGLRCYKFKQRWML